MLRGLWRWRSSPTILVAARTTSSRINPYSRSITATTASGPEPMRSSSWHQTDAVLHAAELARGEGEEDEHRARHRHDLTHVLSLGCRYVVFRYFQSRIGRQRDHQRRTEVMPHLDRRDTLAPVEVPAKIPSSLREPPDHAFRLVVGMAGSMFTSDGFESRRM